MIRPVDLNTLALDALYAELSAGGLVRRLLELSRDEDLGPRSLDATSRSAAPEGSRAARIVCRSGGVIAGLAAIPDLIEVFGGGCEWEPTVEDGRRVDQHAAVGAIRGPAAPVLQIERTLLNLLARLSGVATRTSTFMERMRSDAPDARAQLLDTRKTTPGLRMLEKYAVRCGGACCHRLGLFDAVLIKDNHVFGLDAAAFAAHVQRAAQHARAIADAPLRFVEVEVDSMAQFDALLALPEGLVDIVLLDNMEPARLREAVRRRDGAAPWLRLEASGGVRLETVGEIARTGVDRISVGSLTQSAVSLDLGLDAE